jgi:hypothetical protein
MESLLEKIRHIDKRVKEEIIDETGSCEAVLDGIVDIDYYLKSDFKILWILKEPRDVKNGGAWDSRESLKCLDDAKRNEWRPTFYKIIYTSFGILNSFTLWDGMDYIHNNPSMKETLKSIALINLKKLPNINSEGFASNNNEIYEAYKKHKKLILDQIKLINPDVIIGANTLQYIIEDFGFSRNEMKKTDTMEYFFASERLFINAKHPSYFIIKETDYCDDIITVTKRWTETIRL